MTTIERFIALHFNNIKEEIMCGTSSQKRTYLKWLNKGEDPIKLPYWKIPDVKNEDVMDAISLFFHLIGRAAESPDYKCAYDSVNNLVSLAALNDKLEDGINSADKFDMQLIHAEHITKYIITCFDWDEQYLKVRDSYDRCWCTGNGKIYYLKWRWRWEQDHGKDSKNKPEMLPKEICLDSFSNRNCFFYDCCSVSRVSTTRHFFDILEVLRKFRNGIAHPYAKFYFDRVTALEMMVFYLYDYITMVYIIKNVLGCPLKLKDSRNDNGNNLEIVISCPELNDGEKICLYENRNKENAFIEPIRSEDKTATYRVQRFCSYHVCIDRNGTESMPSEKFTVDHAYVSGARINLTLPLEGTTPGFEVKIKDLYIDPEHLSGSIRYIFDVFDKYSGTGNLIEYINMSRPLIMMALTGNNELYEPQLNAAIEELKIKLRDNLSADSDVKVRDLMEELNAKLSAEYKSNEDVGLLLKFIEDSYYANTSAVSVSHETNTSLVEQHIENVTRFIRGEMFSVGTEVSSNEIKLESELSKLAALLRVSMRYPKLVEAELGSRDWLLKILIDLCVESMYYCYDDYTLDLRYNLLWLSHNLRKEINSEKSKVLSSILYDLSVTSSEGFVRIIVVGRSLIEYIFHLLSEFEDDKIKEQLKNCKRSIQKIYSQDSYQKNDIYLRYYSDMQLKTIKDHVTDLINTISVFSQKQDAFRQGYNQISSQIKPTMINRLLMPKYEAPRCKTDEYGAIRMSIWQHIIDCYGSNVSALANILSSSPFLSMNLASLVYLGISPEGLYGEWSAYWDKWADDLSVNKSKFERTVKAIIDAPFIGYKRSLSNKYVDRLDVNRMVATVIFDYEKEMLSKLYSDIIPDYINEIVNNQELTIVEKTYTIDGIIRANASLDKNRPDIINMYLIASRFDFIAKKYTIIEYPNIIKDYLRFDGKYGELLITKYNSKILSDRFGDSYLQLAEKIKSGRLSCFQPFKEL